MGLGVQDVSAEESGAFTGEISAAQLKDAGVKYVIVGHSERRAYHGETDELIGRKLRRVLEAGMTPILCVGETLSQRDAGAETDVVRTQLKLALAGLDAALLLAGNVVFWLMGKSLSVLALASAFTCFAGLAISVGAACLSHLVLKAARLQEDNDLIA